MRNILREFICKNIINIIITLMNIEIQYITYFMYLNLTFHVIETIPNNKIFN